MTFSDISPPAQSSVETAAPSRRTVIRSATLAISLSLWGDQDRGDAAGLELEKQLQQRFGIGLVEAGGRLVEDQELDLLRQGLGDLHQLLLAEAEIGDPRRRRFAQADAGEQVAGARKRFRPVDDAVGGAFVAEEDVLGDRQKRDQRQFLMDDDDAELFGIGDGREVALLAAIGDLAFVGAVRIDAGEHLHQRRLAGAVLAAQRVDLAFLDFRLTSDSALTPGNVLVMLRISRMVVIGQVQLASKGSGIEGQWHRRAAASKGDRPAARIAGGGGDGPSRMMPKGGAAGFDTRRAAIFKRYGLLELVELVVAAVDQHFLPVVLGHEDRLQEVGRHDLDAVVVGLGVVEPAACRRR